MSHINDLVAAHPKQFGTKVIDEIKELEKTWITEQDQTNKELSQLVQTDPTAAQEKADAVSMARAEKTFKRLKAIEAKLVKKALKIKKQVRNKKHRVIFLSLSLQKPPKARETLIFGGFLIGRFFLGHIQQ